MDALNVSGLIHQGAWENAEVGVRFARGTGPLWASAGTARREAQRSPVERSAKRRERVLRGSFPGTIKPAMAGCFSDPAMTDN